MFEMVSTPPTNVTDLVYFYTFELGTAITIRRCSARASPNTGIPWIAIVEVP